MWKKHYKKIIAFSADALTLIGAIVGRFLSAYLLTDPNPDSVCYWWRIGGKCITCGGTHFVREFFSGHFAEAFGHNQLLFICAIYFLISLVFLNLFLLWDVKFAKSALLIMYNIPTAVLFVVGVFVFLISRNIPLFIRIAEIVSRNAA